MPNVRGDLPFYEWIQRYLAMGYANESSLGVLPSYPSGVRARFQALSNVVGWQSESEMN
jgi:hypothetical protein